MAKTVVLNKEEDWILFRLLF